MAAAGVPLRIAIVGDVHEHWDKELDLEALKFLKVQLVLFVGDFGEQVVDLVRDVSELPLPKAVILGNHDAWKTKTDKMNGAEPGIRQQLEHLGDCHVGFGRRDFPELRVSIGGARPFTMGGPDWDFSSQFLPSWYTERSFENSARTIVKQSAGTPPNHVLIVIAHNGPAGLGDKATDICGRDFGDEPGGDHGDPDLTQALRLVRESGRHVPLVAFGHMHSHLRVPGTRRMLVRDPVSGTVYVNTAVVPRVDDLEVVPQSDSSLPVDVASPRPPVKHSSCRNFTVVEMEEGVVRSACETWVWLDPVSNGWTEVRRHEMLHPSASVVEGDAQRPC